MIAVLLTHCISHTRRRACCWAQSYVPMMGREVNFRPPQKLGKYCPKAQDSLTFASTILQEQNTGICLNPVTMSNRLYKLPKRLLAGIRRILAASVHLSIYRNDESAS